MTQKEFDELTIFLGSNNAFIGKKLKNGKPSKLRRVLSEQETMSFVTWFIKSYCKKYGLNEFTLSVNDVPTFKMGMIDGANEVNVEIKEV